MTKAHSALVVVAALLGAAATAAAQEASPDAPSMEKCRAEPRDAIQPGPSAPAGEGTTPAPDSLTATLDPCNGVLAPPKVGDEEMTEPPPSEGRTPIIRPGEMPDEQPPAK